MPGQFKGLVWPQAPQEFVLVLKAIKLEEAVTWGEMTNRTNHLNRKQGMMFFLSRTMLYPNSEFNSVSSFSTPKMLTCNWVKYVVFESVTNISAYQLLQLWKHASQIN